jgi:hypothetical protein
MISTRSRAGRKRVLGRIRAMNDRAEGWAVEQQLNTELTIAPGGSRRRDRCPHALSHSFSRAMQRARRRRGSEGNLSIFMAG